MGFTHHKVRDKHYHDLNHVQIIRCKRGWFLLILLKGERDLPATSRSNYVHNKTQSAAGHQQTNLGPGIIVWSESGYHP
jgi:hypothetical protein